MIEQFQLDNFKNEARAALESYLAALTLPALQGFAPTAPLELTLHAALYTSGLTSAQTLELSIKPLKTVKTTTLLTSGPAPQEPGVRSLEDFLKPEDLARLDRFFQS